ncbi:MAG: TadE/TadG family type IV pilus assembly protein [Thermodesulfobacteriota bacterium]
MRRTPNQLPERGAAALEAALVLPVLLLLAVGAMETASLLRVWLAVQKASAAGTRMAATGQGEETGDRLPRIRAAAERFLADLPGGATEIAVRSWPGAALNGAAREGDAGEPCDMVEVEVTRSWSPATPLMAALLPAELPLSGADRKVNEPWRPCASGP